MRSRATCVVIHDAAALRHPEAYSAPTSPTSADAAAARPPRALITVSEFSRGELVEMLASSPERVDVIPEGVDERFFADPTRARRRALRPRWPYVLVVGTVSARKNLGALEHAARALREGGIELVLAGSERGYLRGATSGLRRLGYVDEALLPGLYAGARALVMPSHYEGFGLPCLEAMAAASRSWPPRRRAAGDLGDAGLLVEPDDARRLRRSALVAAATRRAAPRPADRTPAARAAELAWTADRGADRRAIARSSARADRRCLATLDLVSCAAGPRWDCSPWPSLRARPVGCRLRRPEPRPPGPRPSARQPRRCRRDSSAWTSTARCLVAATDSTWPRSST